jgi:hypothetical protein
LDFNPADEVSLGWFNRSKTSGNWEKSCEQGIHRFTVADHARRRSLLAHVQYNNSDIVF